MQYEQSSFRYTPGYDPRTPSYNAPLNQSNIQRVLPNADLPPYEHPPEYVPTNEVRAHRYFLVDVMRTSQSRRVLSIELLL